MATSSTRMPRSGRGRTLSNMWVINDATDGTVTELSATGETIGTFPVGNDPREIAFDGTHMWVTNRADNTVTEL